MGDFPAVMHARRQVEFFLGFKNMCPKGAGVDFIGKVESMDRDWTALCERYGLAPQTSCAYKPDLWPHESSKDPLMTTRAMKGLLKKDPSLILILCDFLFVDYLLFDYPLPEECRAS